MAVSVTDIGHASSTITETSFAISGVTVPSGALIFVFASEVSTTSTLGTFSDGSNTYTQFPILSGQTNPSAQASYVANCVALSGGAITYTKQTNTHQAGISALYATGIQSVLPNDFGVNATASGSGSAATVTSGIASTFGELLIAVHSNSNSTGTADAGWAAPPDTDTTSQAHIYGGNLVNAGTAAQTYLSTGGTQTRWNAAIYGFIAAGAISNPPFNGRRNPALISQVAILSQPDPWVYSYLGQVGGAQPYARRLLSPAIPGQSVDTPPFTQHSPALVAISYTLWQPNPWVYNSQGPQPYSPKQNAPDTPSHSSPPFTTGGPIAIGAAIIQAAQPNPWVYVYLGLNSGVQPYAPRQMSPGIPGFSADPPKFDRRRLEAAASLISIWQPDPWVYAFQGGWQPYEPEKFFDWLPDIPPFDRRGMETNASLITLWQPNPWVYTYQGGLQPYAPYPLNPDIENNPPPPPGAGKKRDFPDFIPQPARAPKKQPPFRPVWDKPTDTSLIKPPTRVTPPALPLPPTHLFAPPPAPAAAPPSFDHLAPDPIEIERQIKAAREQQDMLDALAILAAFFKPH